MMNVSGGRSAAAAARTDRRSEGRLSGWLEGERLPTLDPLHCSLWGRNLDPPAAGGGGGVSVSCRVTRVSNNNGQHNII